MVHPLMGQIESIGRAPLQIPWKALLRNCSVAQRLQGHHFSWAQEAPGALEPTGHGSEWETWPEEAVRHAAAIVFTEKEIEEILGPLGGSSPPNRGGVEVAIDGTHMEHIRVYSHEPGVSKSTPWVVLGVIVVFRLETSIEGIGTSLSTYSHGTPSICRHSVGLGHISIG